MPESLLTRAHADDLPILLELVEEFYVLDRHAFDRDRVAAALGPLLASQEFGVVYLVERDQGYIVLTWGYSLESCGREALVDEIYLRERGQGLGARVMRAVFDHMLRQGVVKMSLETERHNSQARQFYSRQGFIEDDSIWMSRELAE